MSNYPLIDQASELRAVSGRPLSEVTLDALDDLSIADVQISPATLRAQAEIARQAGFRQLATNLVRHSGGGGSITCRLAVLNLRDAIEIVCTDEGTGIPDISEAMKDGFSSLNGSLGRGLSSARDLVDDFAIESKPGATRVTMRKWLR